MKVKITAEVWSAVISPATSSDSVPGYLYDHTVLQRQITVGARAYGILCTTVVRWLDTETWTTTGTDAEKEAVRLAEYQCARLQSGLYFGVVAGDLDAVYSVFAQQGLSDDDAAPLHYQPVR